MAFNKHLTQFNTINIHGNYTELVRIKWQWGLRYKKELSPCRQGINNKKNKYMNSLFVKLKETCCLIWGNRIKLYAWFTSEHMYIYMFPYIYTEANLLRYTLSGTFSACLSRSTFYFFPSCLVPWEADVYRLYTWKEGGWRVSLGGLIPQILTVTCRRLVLSFNWKFSAA